MLSEAEDEKVQLACTTEVEQAAQAAEAAAPPDPRDLLAHVFEEGPSPLSRDLVGWEGGGSVEEGER